MAQKKATIELTIVEAEHLHALVQRAVGEGAVRQIATVSDKVQTAINELKAPARKPAAKTKATEDEHAKS